MEYDVVIVGAGPAGLSTAIRLKQLAIEKNTEITVCVLEKGSALGAHILSGAVMDPIAMNELIPDWRKLGAPLDQPVITDDVLILSKNNGSRRIPDWLVPHNLHNRGCYIISLGKLVQWLGEQAENIGVEIFPGFAAAEILYDERNAVKGVATGSMGLGKDNKPTSNFQLGMELHAKYTIFAEGARGSLGKELISHYALNQNKDPQSFAIGIKELWEVPPEQAKPGLVVHTSGWPMNESEAFGGGFLYHLPDHQVSLGFVIGLDYQNPWLKPFEELQRWKHHPAIKKHIMGGKRLQYGARAINNGGLQSLPTTIFPGGALVGCDAGYLNAARIKGSHAAIKSAMLCADATFKALEEGRSQDLLNDYPTAFANSWLYKELEQSKNFKAWFKKGPTIGKIMTGIEQWLLPKVGMTTPPWTLHHHIADHNNLKPANACEPIQYPKPDGVLSFDKLSSVFISNTNHEENQPSHLVLRNHSTPQEINLPKYQGPESRYCPAGVYEYIEDEKTKELRLQINAQNCVHCKTCDIKDPTQNIHWVPPEGGGGPNYTGM
jgi:electron-transferring-flavoprotein dehydrogenase